MPSLGEFLPVFYIKTKRQQGRKALSSKNVEYLKLNKKCQELPSSEEAGNQSKRRKYRSLKWSIGQFRHFENRQLLDAKNGHQFEYSVIKMRTQLTNLRIVKISIRTSN